MKKWYLITILVLIVSFIYSNAVFAVSVTTKKQQTAKSKITQKVVPKEVIKVTLNNKTLNLKNQPYIKGGKVFVPFKEVLEKVDKGIKWEEEQQVVYAKIASTEIYIKTGMNYSYVNGYKIQLEMAPELKGNVIYVPYILISESLSSDVNWNSKTKTINIKYINTIYKIGETATYNKMEYSIDEVDSSSFGVLEVNGKVSAVDEKIVIEVSDDNGYVLSQTMDIGEKDGDMYKVSCIFDLPTCHNFEAKHLTLKVMNKDKKLVKIGEYLL